MSGVDNGGEPGREHRAPSTDYFVSSSSTTCLIFFFLPCQAALIGNSALFLPRRAARTPESLHFIRTSRSLG